MAKIDIHDRQWTNAIDRWKSGDASRLEAKMRGAEPVPEAARAFLADLIAGKAKKKRGRKVASPSIAEATFAFMGEYEIQKHFLLTLASAQINGDRQALGTPTERALARCAEKFGLTEDQVSKIVFPRKA